MRRNEYNANMQLAQRPSGYQGYSRTSSLRKQPRSLFTILFGWIR
jgi:hypothetical protein